MNCWLCLGWGVMDRIDTGETAWSDKTGGERGQRFPVYRLEVAVGTYHGKLIACPACKGHGGAPTEREAARLEVSAADTFTRPEEV